MTEAEARERFAAARVARLATHGPHLVPFCFAVGGADADADAGNTIWSAVDAKPKATRELRRLRNIAADPRASVLVDAYDDSDWSRLWWVRADGVAEVLDDAPEALALLCDKYPQYREAPPAGPFVRITVERWSSWSAT